MSCNQKLTPFKDRFMMKFSSLLNIITSHRIIGNYGNRALQIGFSEKVFDLRAIYLHCFCTNNTITCQCWYLLLINALCKINNIYAKYNSILQFIINYLTKQYYYGISFTYNICTLEALQFFSFTNCSMRDKFWFFSTNPSCRELIYFNFAARLFILW